jgi:hypothetical protein
MKLNKQTNAVDSAEATLLGFQKQRDVLVDKQAVLAERRRVAAFEAHLKGDTKLLDDLAEEAVRLDHRIAGLDDAIKEAERRVAQAQDRAARETDRAKAQALRGELRHFEECAAKLDVAFATIAEVGHEFHDVASRMHSLGAPVPSGQQVDSLGYRSLLTVIAASPWARHFDHVAPNERRTFSQLVAILSPAMSGR